MDYSNDFIPAIKAAFGGVDYIAICDHFKQRWVERKADMKEDEFCAIISNGLNKPIAALEQRFYIIDKSTRTKIVCERKKFRLPENKVGTLVNLVTIITTN